MWWDRPFLAYLKQRVRLTGTYNVIFRFYFNINLHSGVPRAGLFVPVSVFYGACFFLRRNQQVILWLITEMCQSAGIWKESVYWNQELNVADYTAVSYLRDGTVNNVFSGLFPGTLGYCRLTNVIASLGGQLNKFIHLTIISLTSINDNVSKLRSQLMMMNYTFHAM